MKKEDIRKIITQAQEVEKNQKRNEMLKKASGKLGSLFQKNSK